MSDEQTRLLEQLVEINRELLDRFKQARDEDAEVQKEYTRLYKLTVDQQKTGNRLWGCLLCAAIIYMVLVLTGNG